MMINRRRRTLGAAIVIILACSIDDCAFEASAASIVPVSEFLRYLPEFEYLTQVDPGIETIVLNELRWEVIPRLHHLMEIDVNGNMDGKMAQLTTLPRCEFELIDGPETDGRSKRYAVQGNYYWRVTTDGIAAGYPKLISTKWKGLPSNIDAAFTDGNERTYFFKGSEYWVYVNGKMVGHHPRKIRKDFPGIPDNIDAVTVWNEDGQIYFYKGSKFWRFDPARRVPVKMAHSEPISNWPGLPENVDAVISYNGKTHFFKGGYSYQFDDRIFSMDPMSPYDTGHIWFGCSSESTVALWSDWWYSEPSREDD